MTVYSVYGLYDPEEPEVLKYIGRTTGTLSKRVADHVSEVRFRLKHKKRLTAPKMVWILGLLREDRVPGIRYLGEAETKVKAERLEQLYINENPDCLNVRSARCSGRPLGIKSPGTSRPGRSELNYAYRESQGYPDPEAGITETTANRKHLYALTKAGKYVKQHTNKRYEVRI